MFQGIIEQKAQILYHKNNSFTVGAPKSWSLPKGASVAVNGVCLTVAQKKCELLSFDLGRETLELTNLGLLKQGDWVNLERPLRFGEPVSGHLVLGHVEGLARVEKVRQNDRSVDITLSIPGKKYMVFLPKGCVAIEGVSLTINKIWRGKSRYFFQICLIPETIKATNLAGKKEGALVNIETDYLAKTMLRGVVLEPRPRNQSRRFPRPGHALHARQQLTLLDGSSWACPARPSAADPPLLGSRTTPLRLQIIRGSYGKN